MIPNHNIPSQSLPTNYMFEKDTTRLTDLQLGGIRIQDSSMGFSYQRWLMYYEDNWIKLKGEISQQVLLIKQVDQVTDLSFAFDSSLSLIYSYTVANIAYLVFYHPINQEVVTQPLPSTRSVRLCYDDRRESNSAFSDVIVAYINNVTNMLCYRLSRDRYQIERPLKAVPENSTLVQVGMSTDWRLQFKILH